MVDIVAVQNQLSLEYTDPIDKGEVDALRRARDRVPARGRRSAASATRTPASDPVASRERGVSPQQVALAWLLSLSPVVIPIPGASRPESITDSVRAVELELIADELGRSDRGAVLGGSGTWSSAPEALRQRSARTATPRVPRGRARPRLALACRAVARGQLDAEPIGEGGQPVARRAALAGLEVGHLAVEAVAAGRPAVLVDPPRLGDGQRLAGVVAVGEVRARARARPRRPPRCPRPSPACPARAPRRCRTRDAGAAPTTTGAGRRSRTSAAPRRRPRSSSSAGGTPWRGSRPEMRERTEARPLSRPS